MKKDMRKISSAFYFTKVELSPFLMAIFITCITFAIERLLTISKAAGTGSLDVSLKNKKQPNQQ